MSTEIIQRPADPVAPTHYEDGGSVSSLIHLAIERGVNVEVLERLVALQERVTERNARAAFFEAVAAFQEECPPIHKSKTADIVSRKSGTKFSYNYAPLDQITHVIRPVLKRYGLSYSWNVNPGDGVLIVTCVLRHIEGHSESADFPVPNDGDGRMSAAQANGAALTYGKRQSLTSVLGLTTSDEDRDGRDMPSADTITDAQAADLDALIDEVGADRGRFLRWLGVSDLADLRASEYRRAEKALEAKRKS